MAEGSSEVIMLKILFFIETLSGGGAEKVLIDLVNHMDQTRFDITVQTLWPSETGKKLAEGIRYKTVYRSESRLNHYRMRFESGLGLTYRLHMKADYDIECAYLEMGTTKILAASSNKKSKKIAWVHCDLAVQMADVLDDFVKKATPQYSKYDRVVCVSEDVLHSFRTLFGDKPASCVLHNTIDDQMIRQNAEMPLPDGIVKRRTTIVTLGRLTHQKAYDRLLKVHSRLIRDGFDYDLWILGEGEDRQKLENFINANNLQDSVRLLGFKKNPYPFIKAADFLVCSSRYEGFSTFVTEGLILGKPIATTDCTGMHELLGDSEFGLITENSTEGLYMGIKRFLTDPGLVNEYADRAAERGRDFTSAELTDTTERFFEEVCAAGKKC